MTTPLHFVSPARLVAGLIPAALALALGGCGGGSSDSATYTLGGTVSALTASGLIQQSGTQTLSVAANATSFAFTTAVSGSYDVTILTQPAGETCSVANASGSSSGSAVTSVAVTCRPYGVYVANQGSNTIATFSVGSAGALTATPAATLATPFMPDSIVVSSDGLRAWVAYLDDNLISSLTIDSSANVSLMSASAQAVSAGDVLALSPAGTS